MADNTIPITPGSGASVRTVTNAGVDSGAHQQVVSIGDSAGNLLGTAGAPFPMQQVDQSATISIGANATSSGQISSVTASATGVIHLTGTWVATVQVQITGDGTNWVNITGSNVVMNAASGAYIASGNLTATGIYQIDMAGFAGIRVITTAWTSGTVTGVVRTSAGAGSVAIEGTPSVSLTTSTGVSAVGVGASSGGTAVFYVSTGTNAAQSVRSSAGSLQTLMISNTAASTQYVKLFNTGTATLGTTAAVVDIPVAAGATVTPALGPNGQRFSTGISFSISGAAGATNNTANTAGVYVALTYA